ncbi:ABC transporter ATP-binding protein [Thermomonospora cellulosilytica]|uniref:ABC-type multidrug transport system fused ATPase/permease subunit n=1 Tax=Thermomonospora cellulosilytica TaxID=1411118 RepID=A0A7W3MW00_9ACTN|nr:ABC transporter ATP-binding protein [Thermomonospora cellulosilytica]MBA9002906.1 ABC-type multidrug transport system fused ATPase/permease subunit [Thermomonospora cellulosilytica]
MHAGLLSLVARHRGPVAAGAVLTLAASAFGLAQPLLVRRVIEDAGTGRTAWGALAALVALFLAQALAAGLRRYTLACTGEGVVLAVREALAEHLLRLRMPVYDRHRTGDLIARAATDAAALRRMVATGFTDLVAGAIGLAGAVALMIWLDRVLFAMVAAMVAAAVTVPAGALRAMRTLSLHGRQATGEMAADLERALGAIRTVRAARAEGREAARIARRARAARAAGVRAARLDAVAGPAGELAVTGSFLLVVLVGGARVAAGDASVADLVAFLMYVVFLAGPLGSLFEAVSVVQQGSGALRRVGEALSWPREPDGDGVPPQARPAEGPVLLEFRDVWFGYAPDRPVLRGVSLQIPRRGHVALVGPSGAGKSTVFALIERFYEPDRGRILFEGADLRELDRSAYRSAIGLVEQDCPIMYGTLRDNLAYAVPRAGDAELERVIELAGLSRLVERLPRGLDTPVGERGAALSGGERRRIAIARALLARPALLLLDEPSSRLDAGDEDLLRRTVARLAGECAVVVIGHRSGGVRDADLIVVLDDGRVTATGVHEELLETSPRYRDLAGAERARTAGPGGVVHPV